MQIIFNILILGELKVFTTRGAFLEFLTGVCLPDMKSPPSPKVGEFGCRKSIHSARNAILKVGWP